MSNKIIKNEQWSVKQLMSKINNKEITKPKFQRKRKWDILPKKEHMPNEQSYIKFLYDTENSVHAITFGQETTLQGIYFSNIDGNNRINAIKHFIDTPFDIFNEYLTDLNNFIDRIEFNAVNKDLLKNIFRKLSYNQIMNFKYNKYFNENGYQDLYDSKLKIHRDEFEPVIENIQDKLKLNGTDLFDSNVKINVNLFEGYNTDELCKTFEDINRYNSKLTETELLACRLYKDCDFKFECNIFKTELKESIDEYYTNKAEGEVLDCYIFDKEENINSHDFIIGFQNLCSKKYDFIGKSDIGGLSLFFKLYKALNGSFIETFTTKNVNRFIKKVTYSCEILNEAISNIFTDNINSKLFNKTCQNKLTTLKKNNLFILFSSIIGFQNKEIDKSIIINNLEKCLLYHFFVSDLKNKDVKQPFLNYDPILYVGSSSFIEATTKNLLSNPETISSKLTSDLFSQLLNKLFIETNTPHKRFIENGQLSHKTRRSLQFFQKTIMFYYYKGKIPTNMLDNDFSIEHIVPNSSEWEEELDKDRTGNLIPIFSTMNSKRGNKHINLYKKNDEGTKFCNFIKDIIPSNNEYENIITYDRKPIIKNNNLYNKMCSNNEEMYRKNFIDCLFKSVPIK